MKGPVRKSALSPKSMRLREDASREASTAFGPGPAGVSANRLGQRVTKKLGPIPGVTSLNLGIGKQKKSKRND